MICSNRKSKCIRILWKCEVQRLCGLNVHSFNACQICSDTEISFFIKNVIDRYIAASTDSGESTQRMRQLSLYNLYSFITVYWCIPFQVLTYRQVNLIIIHSYEINHTFYLHLNVCAMWTSLLPNFTTIKYKCIGSKDTSNIKRQVIHQCTT